MRRGHCSNLPSRCEKAKSKEPIPITGPRTACPECGKPVVPAAESAGGRSRLLAGLACVIAIAIITLFLLRPHKPQADRSVAGASANSEGLNCAQQPVLTLNGSDVLGKTLAPDLVEAWLRSFSVQQLRRVSDGRTLTVSGKLNGSTCAVRIIGPNAKDGLAALQGGTADIAMFPRQLNDAEVQQLKGLGDMRSSAAEHVVAIDALSVVLNNSSSLLQLSRGELSDVLAGRVTNWSAVGRSPGPINVYAAGDGSRASDTTGELLGLIGSTSQRTASDAGAIEGVSRDGNGLGLVSFPASNSVRTIAIGERGATAIEPNADTIATQNYPLTRRLYFYSNPRITAGNSAEFLSFVQGKAGQEVVNRAGYGGQNINVAARYQIRSDASDGYKSLVANARQLNVVFRFRTGRAELDNKALDDLKRLLAYLATDNSASKPALILIGFADAEGQKGKNLILSKQRAESVASALLAQNVTPSLVRWFGDEQPVGDNATATGRERNRRVEVWTTK